MKTWDSVYTCTGRDVNRPMETTSIKNNNSNNNSSNSSSNNNNNNNQKTKLKKVGDKAITSQSK